MTLTCCNAPSFFQICFGACMSTNNGNKLGNKVGSSIALNEIVDNTSTPISIIGSKLDLSQSKIDIENGENQTEQSNDSEKHVSMENSGVPEVIVQQPINKIKIVNVTYQRTLYKKNTVRRISNAQNGHIHNFRNSSDPISTVDTSTIGNQLKTIILLCIFKTLF